MSRHFARAALALVVATAATTHAAGDAQRGAQVFQACAACHSLEPERNMTGPSLAGVLGRKAGSLESFARYSAPLKKSGIVWNERALDAWITDPGKAVPGNSMLFQGLSDARARADLLAYLRATSEGKAPAAKAPALPDLKRAPADSTVTAIRHCRDSYFVTTGKGETRPFWEFNLRFKTDSSSSGPAPGKPVLVGQGMQGDRAQVVFSRPGEISSFIREGC